MNISIITATFNSGTTVRDCIESVNKQDFNNIEHIIVDCLSNDDTLGIIRSSPNRVSKIVSEKDQGIYDAMNKGIRLATGDIIGILNSDDMYIDQYVISKVADCFINHEIKAVYGDLYYVKKENTDKIIRVWKTRAWTPGSFKNGWHPPHPTFFVRREIYDEYGCFDLNFKLAADFELMLRFLEKYQIKSEYIEYPFIKMRLGGATNKSITNILSQNIECYKAFKKNKLSVSVYYPFARLVPKITQFLH